MRLAKLLLLSATIATATLGAAAAGQVGANTLNAAIGPMPLNRALEQFAKQTGLQVVYVSTAATGVESSGAAAGLSRDAALRALLSGTGLQSRFIDENTVTISKVVPHPELTPIQIAQAAPARPAVETVTVTSSKLGGADVQSIPIAITALSQEQLTATQTAGGPDLVKQVPNMTFTKTNFSGYSIQLRGIGTQAISVTTDPAVAVAFNDIPFIRNHFFEQEFYDVSQVEVLRGPQGTLYGRNATAGVVNLISAKPTDQFEAMASAEIGNYHQRRFEGMINLPIVDDRLDIRFAGEWTKRQGYSFNAITDQRIDGRDLWSTRLSIGLKPVEDLQINFVWEHFQEDDDRLRSSKQLCATDKEPTSVNGVPVPPIGSDIGYGGAFDPSSYLSQGCKAASLYAPESFGVPDGFSLPYVKAAKLAGQINPTLNPYASTTQSTNLRDIESTVDPHYRARNETVELNADYNVKPELTLTSQTGYNQDSLFSTEDYNRFNTSPGIFVQNSGHPNEISDDGVFCDPQIGCANRMVGIDLSNEHAWQLSSEIRLASKFSGPLNFSFGGNYLHYETEENYYVFINALTVYALSSFGGTPNVHDLPYVPGVSDNHECLSEHGGYIVAILGGEPSFSQCNYIDPNPISTLNNRGHNYFLSQNPYVLDSYAGFGEVYYDVLPDVKLTAGLRWTDDQKHFVDIPSELLTDGWGYANIGAVDQQWKKWTGRFTANWTPKLDFTDQTLIYGSYARGYKAGGANPPGAILLFGGLVASSSAGNGGILQPIHPLTFDPEYIDAFEVGSKNTLLDGALTINGDFFFYNYKGYQISEIVDRTSINLNFDAKVKGAELEMTWEPSPGLRFNFAGGYEATRLNNGDRSIDLIDRADVANHPDWMEVRPYPTQSSDCILPNYVVAAMLQSPSAGITLATACGVAYNGENLDPVTQLPFVANPSPSTPDTLYVPPGYTGFDPTGATAINNGAGPAPNLGEGFYKNLSGKELPNAPPFTISAGAQYTVPISSDWAGTVRADYYWQDYSWARVFNDNPYDRIRGYTNVNLTLILTSQNGWQVMLYDKNVFNETAITGTFLNSDDSGLTTNLFLTDPKLIGIRVTKNW